VPLVTINGFPVVEGQFSLPRAGRWSANLAIDAESAEQLQGPVTVDLGGQLQLRGTVRRSGPFLGLVTAEVVGGGAGLMREVQPKAYQGVGLDLVLRDALAEVGEQLAADSELAVLQVQLAKWIRLRALAAEEVASLLDHAPAGAVARVKPDGTVWVGRDSYPDAGLAPGSYDLLRDDHYLSQAEIGVEVPTLLPGTTFLGRHVEEVTYNIKPDMVRVVVHFAQAAEPGREPPGSTHANDLDQLILRRLRPHRYHRVFPARVVAQNADLTLELALDDDSVPGLSGVPIRAIAPGASLKVAGGSRCAVQFEAGDPQRPVVTLFEPGAGGALELVLAASTKVTINTPLLNVGGAAPADAAALNSKVLAEINALKTLFNTHTHVTTCAVGPGSATPPPVPATPSTDVSSVNLKVQS